MILVIIYAILLVVVGFMAKSRNRVAAGWVVLGLFISPVIVMIILACIGENHEGDGCDDGHDCECNYDYRADECDCNCDPGNGYYADGCADPSQVDRHVLVVENRQPAMMACPFCGIEIGTDSVFCKLCGGNVREHNEKIARNET